MKFINNLVAFKDIVTFLESICVLFAEKRGYCPSQNELNKTLNNYKKKKVSCILLIIVGLFIWLIHSPVYSLVKEDRRYIFESK